MATSHDHGADLERACPTLAERCVAYIHHEAATGISKKASPPDAESPNSSCTTASCPSAPAPSCSVPRPSRDPVKSWCDVIKRNLD
ncbi:hypothetical protein QFZ55_007815 [Streptomyces luteogriseus]|uniref:hypothetical protein n=1 Tax=Streptomyces luteogriseus TaxID=68233 RepID=UPI002787FEE6|nr:hypothetical protein [Streptomyces luteogriseus]MDQ0718363.1 hypothetical protein [Streptomyces luteogriseus]